MTRAFGRMAKSVLRRLGRDAFLLQGPTQTPARINIERGVALSGPYDDATFTRDVLTLESALSPKIGDRVRIGASEYTLDALVSDSGHLARFTLQPA